MQNPRKSRPLTYSCAEPYCRGLAQRVPATARLSARGAASARFAGLPGTALPIAHHLDQRWPVPELERGVFSRLPLPVGTVRRGGSSQVKRPGRRPAQSNRSNIRQRSSRRTSRAILSKWACNCERTWTRAGGSPVFADKLTQHLLDAAGLAQFEKIRLAAVLQLDDKWLLAKAAVTTHRCKQLLLTRTPERNACEVPGYCVPAREDDGFSKHNLELRQCT